MSKRTVVFEVTPDAGILAYWIRVGATDVPLTNGKGSVLLSAPATHVLTWWMKGEPGAGIAIIGTSGGGKVVEVKASKIPKDEREGAGVKRFDL